MDRPINKWIVALVVIIPTLLEVIDTSVVNVALDHIRGSLSATVDEATWAITSYLVSNAIIIPLTGWLARVFGRKRYLLFSIVLFTVSSFLCGMAWSLPALIFFRVLQGLGGGALQPMSQTILLETFPPREHGKAMAVFGIGVIFAPIIGPILGGWITDNWSWNWIFYINIPIGILSIIMVSLVIKDPPYLKRVSLSRIDYRGLMLISVGLGLLQVVLDRGQQDDWFNSGHIVLMAVISLISLLAFVFVELRSKEPVVNLRVFRNKSFAVGNSIMFVTFFVLFATIVILPLFLQRLMGYNALWAGYVIAPGGLAVLVAMPIVGKLASRVSPKLLLIIGLLLNAYSTWYLTSLNLNIDFDFLLVSRIFMGVGMACVFINLTMLTLSSVPKEEMGNATGIYNLLRNLGGSFGVAFVTTILARRTQFHHSRLVEQMNPYDPAFQHAVSRVTALPQLQGAPAPGAAEAVIFQESVRQANLFAFVDVFFICTVALLCIVPFVAMLRRPKHAAMPVAAH
ncbi:MAG: DHA2 family efflux MFS transporter permease subunit [Candidatus Omnitrophica bacterium]|nr:DHA2 family efflux MFS transporter permease subunit [Candidatus Omnitrophota bacterium]